jgi:apolipoprotein D and lipocalin family protein
MKRLILLAALALAGCYPDHPSARYVYVGQVATPVDKASLAGTWYEIAQMPAEVGAVCTHRQVTYTPQADGSLAVLNQCRSAGGRTLQTGGVATPLADLPGQFEVRLDGAGRVGNLIVLGTADQGRTLFLGTTYRTSAYVLHRDRHMTPGQIDRAEEVFRKNGYDVAALQRTPQR